MIYNRNGVGYADPTAGAALARITADEKRAAKMEQRAALSRSVPLKTDQTHAHTVVAYIASPFAGNIAVNSARAKKYSRFAANKGVVPFTPHLLYPQFLNDGNAVERATGLAFGLAMLAKCDELWVFGDVICFCRVETSRNCRAEMSRSCRNRCPHVGDAPTYRARSLPRRGVYAPSERARVRARFFLPILGVCCIITDEVRAAW